MFLVLEFVVEIIIHFDNVYFIRNHSHGQALSERPCEKELFAEYTYKCDKHTGCPYEMRVTFSGSTKSKSRWVATECGEHSEEQTSIQLKRGINPIFLPLIDSEIERNTATKTILKLIRGENMG